jgi:hypothetical protein
VRERLPHAGGGARKVQLSCLDTSCLGGGVDVERIFLGSETKTVASRPGRRILGSLVASTAATEADLMLLLRHQVAQ